MLMSEETAIPPLVILCIDAADIELVKRWSAEGFLPTLTSVIDAGAFFEVTGADLVNETGSWVSLFSGVAKHKHGFYHFRRLVPGTYTLEQTMAASAKDSPPFWQFLCEGTNKAAIVDPPEFDALPDVPGIQLTNWAAHESDRLWKSTRSEPAHILPEVMAKFGAGEKLDTFTHDGSESADFADFQRALARIALKGKVSRDIIARDRFDVVVATFFEAHTVGHRLWSYQSDFSAPSRLTNGVRDLYQAIDGELAQTMAQLPINCNVFIVSVYGMAGMFPTTGLVEAFLRDLGYQTPRPTAQFVTGGETQLLAMLRRAIPHSLRKGVSQYLPTRVQEQLIASDFATNTDWGTTLAFHIPNLYNGLIRLNVNGREPQGIIEPGAEFEAMLDRIEADLRLLVDPKTGQPAVANVVRTASAFDCGIHHGLPDLFVEWEWAPHFMDTVVHPNGTLTQDPGHYHRSSFHRPTGFVAAAGPSIPPTDAIRTIDVRDLAPTFLALLDVPIPPVTDGTPSPFFAAPTNTSTNV